MQAQPSRFHRALTILVLTSVGLTTFPGCGGSKRDKITGTVEGTVTFDGKPVKAGTVSFVATATGAGAGAPITDSGTFKVADPVPVGTYSAFVLPITLSPDDIADGKTQPPSADIPEKYRSSETSGLTFEVREGKNTLEVKMTPQAPSPPATE